MLGTAHDMWCSLTLEYVGFDQVVTAHLGVRVLKHKMMLSQSVRPLCQILYQLRMLARRGSTLFEVASEFAN